ncbi:tRNA (adenosine(37)-N6)-threonylcarbamoyltransferase complex dimerization subunit type 1 TsaB [Seongchinamella sediminis]|uniref:tRNA threonylcarbamoyladenosine biosynthesis protein TsaB n=1 Tax=Seongchinamella sediminis TaxID=2283635 RepID=A0A3L7DZT8_9GAMM|nr:tRNA (adenosine(37)-N6)-threonylcarbamoyltransferase complex dimerization subunit type 1 TsaB [Seongchinamella sediminis]RLQ21511.1 tRNA (adenosine(37)-N6)-threonylcarbamoyltransferase complex dimerization subunit type 1 TsaB [Seongchinamella sediminis]
MKSMLAIETATEACSLALWRDPDIAQRHEITPRQHSQRLFGMLGELLPDGQLRQQGIEAVAYGAGPGSFTGLRIAASAVQGLTFAAGIPAIPVSTLGCQVQTALREGLVGEGDMVLSTLDARINEVYYQYYRIAQGLAVAVGEPRAVPPAQIALAGVDDKVFALGSGVQFVNQFAPALREQLGEVNAALLPQAQDLVPLALALAARGELQTPRQVQPVYVRDEINWKKISEQGKRT